MTDQKNAETEVEEVKVEEVEAAPHGREADGKLQITIDELATMLFVMGV